MRIKFWWSRALSSVLIHQAKKKLTHPSESINDTMAEEESNNENRFVGWFASACFSTIALVAITSTTGELKNQDKETKWATSAISVALTMASLAVLGHIAKDRFVNTTIEGGLALIVLSMWAASLPAIMDIGNGLATEPNGEIGNANLYFFSWGSLLASLMVFIKYLSSAHDIGKGTFDFTGWGSLTATSFIVMAVAARLWKNSNCDDLDIRLCNRTEFGLILGAISGTFALVWTFIGAKLPNRVNGGLALCFLTAWVFGIVFLTFGGESKAPAHNMGNFYFFTWASFIVSCYLTADGLGDLIFPLVGMGKKDTASQEEDNKAKEGEGGDDDKPAEADVEDPEADVEDPEADI